MITGEYLKHNDRLYLLKSKVLESSNLDIEVVRKRTNADTVLKKDGYLYFVETITDLEILTDTVLEAKP